MKFYSYKDRGARKFSLWFGKNERGLLCVSLKFPKIIIDDTSQPVYNNAYDSAEWTGRMRRFVYQPGFVSVWLSDVNFRHWELNYGNPDP